MLEFVIKFFLNGFSPIISNGFTKRIIKLVVMLEELLKYLETELKSSLNKC